MLPLLVACAQLETKRVTPYDRGKAQRTGAQVSATHD